MKSQIVICSFGLREIDCISSLKWTLTVSRPIILSDSNVTFKLFCIDKSKSKVKSLIAEDKKTWISVSFWLKDWIILLLFDKG